MENTHDREANWPRKAGAAPATFRFDQNAPRRPAPKIVARRPAPPHIGSLCLGVLLAIAALCGSNVVRGESTIPSVSAADAEQRPGDWLSHGRTWSEQRYSPLSQIDRDSVGELGLAWYVDLPTQRGQEATPLEVDGVLYTTSAWNHVLALDGRTGEVLWQYDPEVPRSVGVKGCCDAVNRGLAFEDGRLFMGTLDGRLIALDARNGELLWSVMTVDDSRNYTITGAPRVVDGKVFIGNGGAEYGVRGYLSAYDAEDGDLTWRFYTVPGGPGDPVGVEPVAAQRATWAGEWWRLGGGGTVWDSMAYDPDSNLLYFGVGNGSPWNPSMRTQGEGDNWFLSSIVAVDADTGRYRWHYQTTPMEAWDFTATQHIILADTIWRGEPRKVLMQAPKNGFFYVLDRLSGELLSAEPFVSVNWATHVDLETGRPAVREEARYWKTGQVALITPSWMGGHNWHPMAYHPETGLVYLPAQETAFPYLAEPEQTPSRLAVNLGVNTGAARLPDDPAVIEQLKAATRGQLIAWDPARGAPRWTVEYPGAWNGGVLSTAGGLVFQGSATGFLHAYDAENGERLWAHPAQTGIVAPPMSYEIDGEQYLAVSAGWGGIFPLMTGELVQDATVEEPINRSRLLVFRLGGEARLPDPVEVMQQMPSIETDAADAQTIEAGFAVYDRYCVNCHGAGAVGGGVVPDLRYSALLGRPEDWRHVVLDGVLADRGMASFASELDGDDVEAVRQYVIDRNRYAQRTGDTERLSR